MPKHRKAVTDHVPIDYEADLNQIEDYFGVEKRRELYALFERWGLRSLDFDDVGAFVDGLVRRLINFALECNALPLRTPLQLSPTVKLIARKPREFLDKIGSYDPQAVALVYSVIGDMSPEHRKRLEEFEWGRGPAPAESEVVEAAHKVLEHLDEERRRISHVGRPALILQRSLVWDLAELFVGIGGKATRSTHFDDKTSPQYYEDGRFCQFLQIVLPPVRAFALKGGFRLKSPRSMIGTLKKDGFGKRTKPVDLGAPFRPWMRTPN